MPNLRNRTMSFRTKMSKLEKCNGNISDVMEKRKIAIKFNGIKTDLMEKTKKHISKTISKKEEIEAVRGASSSTAPEITPINNTETVTRRETHRNILGGEWDREKWFYSNGGTLKKDGSSVELYVPEHAVTKAHISGKVFTDVNIFYSKFKFRETERPVSPMVEFVAHNKVQFDLHLMVKIPIVFNSHCDQSFRVLSISGGDKVESIPLVDKSDKEKLVYYEVRGGNIFVYTKHFTSFICTSCSSNLGFHECFLFGSRHPYPTDGISEVKLVIYLCDGLFSIKDYRQSLCDTEKECSRDFWDRTQIHTGNSDLDDTICSSIELSTEESARDWTIKTRSNGSELFRINPQRLRDIQGIPVVGKWTLTTTASDALFRCHIDIDLKHGNDLHTRTTFDVTKDSTVKIQGKPDKYTDGLDGVSDILMNTLNRDNARDLARKMDMNRTDLKHILNNNANDARECVRDIVSALQGIHGPEFNEKLIPSLEAIDRRDVMEKVKDILGATAPYQGTRKRVADRTPSPPTCSPSKQKN